MEKFPSFKDLIQGKIYTVSELNKRIKGIIDNEIAQEFIWIEGEISNFRGNYSSGHWYFSLKDSGSQISSVCFKWANQYIKFLPESGMEVICCGQVGVYEKQGIYQLNVRYIEPKGIGAQALALEQLKEKLKKEGLFDLERKKELPVLIQKIGIVTSPTGAAIKDILKVLDRRFSNLEIYISPTRVQGENAYKEIVEALNLLYRFKKIDLIIIARGGGSHEDLWSFNEEAVARKVSESPVPVISAVGHEIDVTICDLVADLRAATPSMAAELAVKEKSDYLNELLNLKQRIKFSLTNKVANVEIQLDQYLDRLKWVFTSNVEKVSADLQLLSGKLESLSPLKVLERGYSITYLLPDLRIITTTKSLSKGDEVLMKFKSGKAKGEIKKIID